MFFLFPVCLCLAGLEFLFCRVKLLFFFFFFPVWLILVFFFCFYLRGGFCSSSFLVVCPGLFGGNIRLWGRGGWRRFGVYRRLLPETGVFAFRLAITAPFQSCPTSAVSRLRATTFLCREIATNHHFPNYPQGHQLACPSSFTSLSLFFLNMPHVTSAVFLTINWHQTDPFFSF